MWKLQTLSKAGAVIGSLLDVGKNMQQLTGHEKMFYKDQKASRECRLSEEIDIEHTNEMEQIQLDANEARLREEAETSYTMGTDSKKQFNQPYDNSFVGESLNTIVNCSGLSHMMIPTCNASVQTEDIIVQPKIRLHHKCTESIKSTCAQVSTACGLSVEMACIAVQSTCKALYKHEYFLNIEELPNDQSDQHFEPVPKHPKEPVRREDCKEFAYVLPSACTIADYKHLQASEIECDAGVALVKKESSIKVTSHYDTTSRNSIDGEWPSLILNFSDKQKFDLRPLFFAYKDREQITKLIVETYECLAAAASAFTGMDLTAKVLWEQTDAFKADSVAKNLLIEKTVARSLNFTHEPFHILCKSHIVEKLDKFNLSVLNELEESMKLRNTLESVNPALFRISHPAQFFRGKAAVVEVEIYALLKLVTYDKSANSCPLADEFDYIVEKEGKVKHMSLNHQQRFAKLGYPAASILAALPLLQMFLLETEKNNLLVQACRLYVDCEFFLTELHALAYFTHKVTHPLLNCVEMLEQSQLLHIFPKLYKDLSNGKMDTSKDFLVSYKHLPNDKPESKIVQ